MFAGSLFGAGTEIVKSVVDEIERTTDENYVAGTWNCANGTGSTNDRNNLTTTLKLNKDMTFSYGPYGDLSNNHYSGTYTFKDEDKKNGDGKYSYYMVDFNTNEFILDGVKQDLDGKGISQAEMGITKTDEGKQGILMFVSTYNMYYCYNDAK